MTVKPIPDGYHTVTPYLVVADLAKLLPWLERAFGAKITEGVPDANGVVRHGDVIIGDSHVMLGQAGAEWGARPSTLYLYVEDTDAWYRRAMDAGAKSLREPENQFYGDRSAGVEDPQGNQWWLGTHVEDVSPEEMEKRAAKNWK